MSNTVLTSSVLRSSQYTWQSFIAFTSFFVLVLMELGVSRHMHTHTHKKERHTGECLFIIIQATKHNSETCGENLLKNVH